jgi:hypothetical protein
MFKVGDLVKVDMSEVKFLGIPEEEIGGLLVVNEIISETAWNGSPLLEVRNSDGDYYGLAGNALVSV